MSTRPISVTGSNTSTGELDLDFPNLEAFSGDTILWKIHPKSGVDTIEVIREKTGSTDIWSTRPQNGNHWKGIIKDGVPENYEYNYEIAWKKDGQEYLFDPKISVNPSL